MGRDLRAVPCLPVIDYSATAASTQHAVDDFFGVLGWSTKEQLPFSELFDPLGVNVDLSDSGSGICKVQNTRSRLVELREAVEKIASSGLLRPDEARSIRGRCLFARSFVHARCGARWLQALGAVADAKRARARGLSPRSD